MRVMVIGALAVLTAGLGGCNKKPAETAADGWMGFGGSHTGRYVGVGIYTPGQMWSKLVQVQQPKAPDAAKARLADDQAVIVVVDSHTGEIRSCGDLTGYCIGMNPWKTPLPPAQAAPVGLTAHADTPAPAEGDATPAPISPSKKAP